MEHYYDNLSLVHVALVVALLGFVLLLKAMRDNRCDKDQQSFRDGQQLALKIAEASKAKGLRVIDGASGEPID